MYRNSIKIFFYYVILCNVVFLSCDPTDVYYDIPKEENKLVVFCFFNPDSIWKVHVSKLDHILSTTSDSNSWITNAQILLYEKENLLDIIKYQDHNEYLSTKGLKPEFNKLYKIAVKCDNYEDVSSDFQMLPSAINIDSIKFYDYLLPSVFPNELYNLQESQQVNFHSVSLSLKKALKNQYFKVFTSNNYFQNKESVYLSSTSKQDFIEYYSWGSSILESLKNGNLTLELPFEPGNDEKLSIYTISDSYILFELNFAEYDFVVNTTYLLTPNNIYSNITGGLGLFAGYTSNTLDLTRFSE